MMEFQSQLLRQNKTKVGLKDITIELRDEDTDGQNKTKVGLKG